MRCSVLKKMRAAPFLLSLLYHKMRENSRIVIAEGRDYNEGRLLFMGGNSMAET